MGDVDLDAAAVAFSGAAARVGPLDEWGTETVLRFVRNNPPIPVDGLLCVTANTSPSRAAQRWRCASGRFCKMRGCRGGPG